MGYVRCEGGDGGGGNGNITVAAMAAGRGGRPHAASRASAARSSIVADRSARKRPTFRPAGIGIGALEWSKLT